LERHINQPPRYSEEPWWIGLWLLVGLAARSEKTSR
jgi:hypothetical protein